MASTGTKKRNPKAAAIMTMMSAFLRLIGNDHLRGRISTHRLQILPSLWVLVLAVEFG